MKVKKYMVKNISEAMEQIRNDFGDDAYILDTKKIKKGGFLGIGGEKFWSMSVNNCLYAGSNRVNGSGPFLG